MPSFKRNRREEASAALFILGTAWGEDEHLRVVLRDIERNPLRAGLVGRAEEWPWSSLHAAASGPAAAIRLGPGPAPRGEGWVEAVGAPISEADVARVRESVRRDRPLGDPTWTASTAEALGPISFEAMQPTTRRQQTGLRRLGEILPVVLAKLGVTAVELSTKGENDLT